MAAALLLAPTLPGQVRNPVYVDDSPGAADTLARVTDFVRTGNDAEAVRELQRLLSDEPDRLVARAEDRNLFESVRARAHRLLTDSPDLLERYRRTESARADDLLASGRLEELERSRLLTPAGLSAALRLAQRHLEAGRFDAARRMLDQVQSHPDLGPGTPAARDAATLYAMLARYLDRPSAWTRADEWTRRAELPAPPRSPFGLPPALRDPARTPLDDTGSFDPSSIPSRPLWSAGTSPAVVEPLGDPAFGAAVTIIDLRIIPAVARDLVIINDGTRVIARDRFTLEERWAYEAGSAADPWSDSGAGRLPEDTISVTVAADTVLASSGIVRDGVRTGDRRLHALDLDTGSRRWFADVAATSPLLEGASVRGPALVEADTVVLTLRRSSTGKRITTTLVAGVSLQDGSLQWATMLGSAGALPYTTERRVCDGAIISRGVVYAQDQLGVVGAVEAATGRPLWVRRMPIADLDLASGGAYPAWTWTRPVALDDTIVVLSADRREILQLDRETGALRNRRATAPNDPPSYIVGVGEFIAAVGASRIAVLRADDVGAGPIRGSAPLESGIAGRAVVAGNRLIVPLRAGYAVLDPAAPDLAAASVHQLAEPGAILPLGDQLLVQRGGATFSYLTWPNARKMLRSRIDSEPADPRPAVTLADLAFRTGHGGEVAPAADLAITAIAREPASGASRRARAALFEVLARILTRTEQRWIDPQTDNRGPVLDAEQFAAVLDRVGRIAEAPAERVVHTLALGRLREARSDAPGAIDAYQRVLADEALAPVMWRGLSASVRAEIEAGQRIRRLVRTGGARTYAAFEDEARRALASLPSDAGPDALEAVARRYPGAAVTPLIWLRLVDVHDAAGDRRAALSALGNGLRDAEISRAAGRRDALAADVPGGPWTPAALIAEFSGRLITRLRAEERVFAAAELLERVRADHPRLTPTVGGVALDVAALGNELLDALARARRRPRVGTTIAAETQALVGWTIMPELTTEHAARSPEHVVLLSRRRGEVALWGVGATRADEDAAGLRQLWTRPFGEAGSREPRLLRVGPATVSLLWDDPRSGVWIEHIEAVSGRTLWRTPPLRTILPDDEDWQRRQLLVGATVVTPQDGQQSITDVVHVVADDVIVIAERGGRAAGFDPATGRVLWARLLPVARVFDVDVGAGVVAIAGQTIELDADRRDLRSLPVVVTCDARTGQTIDVYDELGDHVRWIRVADDAPGRPADAAPPTLVAGLEQGVVALDLIGRRERWRSDQRELARSRDAWVIGAHLFVADDMRTMWVVPLATGAATRPLDTYEHLTGVDPIQAVPIVRGGKLTVAFLTQRGFALVDPQPPGGRVLGLDAIDEPSGVVAPAMAENLVVTVGLADKPELSADARVYCLYMLDAESTRLAARPIPIVLWAKPSDVALVDGHVLVTAGGVTIVYPAPSGR